eukprot:scaffold322761_cov28-Tisochrysis_lutea.AAC.1
MAQYRVSSPSNVRQNAIYYLPPLYRPNIYPPIRGRRYPNDQSDSYPIFNLAIAMCNVASC